MDKKIIELAAETLKITVEDAKKNMKVVPEINATYFWNPKRGGGAVIINSESEKLATGSAINFKSHVQAFREGKRN